MGTISINTESKPYMGGLGDSVLLAWLAEAAKGTDSPIELYASGNRRFMLECLSAPIATSDVGSVMPSEAYTRELADFGNRPRWEYVAEFLGIKTGVKRPVANIPEQFTPWAHGEKLKNTANGGPLVLLFPQTHWAPRAWPQASWLFLGLQLKKAGMNPVIMIDHKDPKFTGTPTMTYWGFGLGNVMALMQQADCIIGNDSMPAHLAGTLGCKTIAIMGPTKPTVFSHIPNVQCLTSRDMPCSGCHFAQPFSVACDVGCSALSSISVQQVIEAVKARLDD